MVVITVVYATAEPRRAHVSRTLISPASQTTLITSRSSAPRLLSKISREDLNPQNKNGRCIAVERRPARRHCQFWWVDTRLHPAPEGRLARGADMDNQNPNQKSGDQQQQG